MQKSEPLLRVMGTAGLAAGIVNVTVGGGIFRLPASVATSLGAAAPLAYLVCAVAVGLIVVCIADAGKRVALTGGPYAYIGVALGPYAGFLAGVLLLMIGLFATSAVATVFASSLAVLVPALAGRFASIGVLVATFAFWAIVNTRGVALASRLNTIATIGKLVPLLLVAIGGLFFMHAEHLQVAAWPSPADVARTCLILVFAFAGVEVALVPSGEVRDTERTVPRAIALAMVGITALYLALQVAAQGILGGGLATSTVPLADAAGAAFGSGGRVLLLVGASVSMFGYLGGMVLAVSRVIFALAGDGYLPKPLATVHPTWRTPHVAIGVQALLVVLLAVSNTFEPLAVLANASVLALYFGCAVAAWRLRRKSGEAGGWLTVVPWLACAVILWVLTGMTRAEWLGFGACLALGSVVYLATRGRGAAAA